MHSPYHRNLNNLLYFKGYLDGMPSIFARFWDELDKALEYIS